ncbi:MAG: ankyrin repeat domain-containing protein [Ketobacter sp.]|nr:MAG: ankyrin repeat domain-containing protein [Ketobacter sp.]
MLDFIRGVIRFIKTTIAVLILAVLAVGYGYKWWLQHKEEQQAENRVELIESAIEDSKSHNHDKAALLQANIQYCENLQKTVRELVGGSDATLCENTAQVLFDATQHKGINLAAYGELAASLCKNEDEQDAEYCEEEKERSRQYITLDGMALALCDYDSAWIELDEVFGWTITKRGRDVYRNSGVYVDCDQKAIDEYDYEGFFPNPLLVEPESPQWLQALWEALHQNDSETIGAIASAHEFGRNSREDKWMLYALATNDSAIEHLQKALAKIHSVNFDFDYYEQPLGAAIESPSPKSALALIDAGAEVLRPGGYGIAPIAMAASRGQYEVVERLLSHGADADGVKGSETGDFGEPLRWAAWGGHQDVVDLLLRHGAQLKPDNREAYPQWEPNRLLASAAHGGNLVVVRMLVERGEPMPEPTLQTFENILEGGNPEVLAYLFEQGLLMPEQRYHRHIVSNLGRLVNDKSKSVAGDAIQFLEQFISHKLDFSHIYKGGSSMGHHAIKSYSDNNVLPSADIENGRNKDRFAMMLVEAVLNAGVDINHPDQDGETLLMIAASRSKSRFVEYLLAQGANPSLKNNKGETALDQAIKDGRRLTRIWDKNLALKAAYTDTIRMLGGDPAVLDKPVTKKNP